MSWCGGGEIRPTPGVEWRTLAMVLSTLCPGNWPPSPGLAPCAILICITSELTRYSADPETARSDLLDGRAHAVAVRQRLEAVALLAAFAGVRLAANTVHGDGERGVRFARNRAERHGAGGEAPHDVLGRLDLLDGDRLAGVFVRRLDAEQAADRQQPLVLFVYDLGEGAVMLLRIAAHRVLQPGDGLGGPDMVLAAHAHGIVAADVEHRRVNRGIAEGVAVAAHCLFRDFGQAHALEIG